VEPIVQRPSAAGRSAAVDCERESYRPSQASHPHPAEPSGGIALRPRSV